MFSLEKLCLDLIVQEFELFYNAFTVSKNDTIFEFLQMKYSAILGKELHKAQTLKMEYFELLLNKHLNYLNDRWLGTNEYFWDHIFVRLPNLKEITFWSCYDGILECLATFCPKIATITIVMNCNVTDKGVKYLCIDKNGMVPCPELKNLFIEPTKVTDVGVECLIRNLPSLERIDYANVPLLIHKIHVENVREFKTVKFYSLVELNFLQPEFKTLPNRTDILKSCFTACPKLKSLSCYISDGEQLYLLTNTHLKKLNLEFADPNININCFLKLKLYNITSLKLTDCSMSISALGLHFPVLEYFYANRVIFSDDDDLKLKFSSLNQCDFMDIKPSSHKAIRLLLSSSPILESVSLYNISLDCMFSLELKTQILLRGKNPCAKFIGLTGINATSEMKFLEDIVLNCSSLKEFSVRDESLSHNELEQLRMTERLENLAKCLPNKLKIHLR